MLPASRVETSDPVVVNVRYNLVCRIPHGDLSRVASVQQGSCRSEFVRALAQQPERDDLLTPLQAVHEGRCGSESPDDTASLQ